MGLQTQVNLYRAAGVQGDKATPNQSIYFPKQMVAEGNVTVGTFVFYGSNADKRASNTKANATAADLVGFVERVINYANYGVTSEGTLIVPSKSALTIAMCGDYWATATTDATARQKVFANFTTGTISTNTAGTTVPGAVETPWTVIQGGKAGTPILISNWTHVNVAATTTGRGD